MKNEKYELNGQTDISVKANSNEITFLDTNGNKVNAKK